MRKNIENDREDELETLLQEAKKQPGVTDLAELTGQAEYIQYLTNWYLGITKFENLYIFNSDSTPPDV